MKAQVCAHHMASLSNFQLKSFKCNVIDLLHEYVHVDIDLCPMRSDLLFAFLETKLKEAAGQKFYHPTIPVLFVQAEEWKIIETNDNALHFCWPVLLLLPREEDNQTLGSTTYFSDKSLHSCYTQLKSRGEMARFFFRQRSNWRRLGEIN